MLITSTCGRNWRKAAASTSRYARGSLATKMHLLLTILFLHHWRRHLTVVKVSIHVCDSRMKHVKRFLTLPSVAHQQITGIPQMMDTRRKKMTALDRAG